MWQLTPYILTFLILFLLCVLQDRELDEDLKFLIQYRYIQDNDKRAQGRK